MTEAALSNVNVLDMSVDLAGNFCAKLLADFGAEVIKIERPGEGDPVRKLQPFFKDEVHPEKSGLFLYLNTNKKSISLNLRAATGARIFKELIRHTDIVVESFTPGVMSSLGLSYETLAEINPRVIMVSITPFGQTGPYRDYKTTNFVLDALSGQTYLRGGTLDRPPVNVGFSIAEYAGGICGFLASLLSLFYQQELGEGQYADVSTLEALLYYNEYYLLHYPWRGLIPNRAFWLGSLSYSFVPTKDGYELIATHPGRWEELIPFVGRQELQDPKYSTQTSRVEHAAELNSIVRSWAKEQPKMQLFQQAQEWRLPFGYVATIGDLFEDPQNKARGFFVDVEHPVVGRLDYPGAPFRMSETPWRIEKAAPLLAEHNEEIYCGRLGYSKDTLVRLRESGII